MTQKYIITKATKKPFKSSEGEMIDYFWYKATRLQDGVTVEFGSTREYEVDEKADLELEKTERANGKFGYKEITKIQ